MTIVRASDGSTLHLGTELGRGGEGSVHSVHEAPGLVVKLYREDLRARRRPKIETMVRCNSSALVEFVAWPILAVFEPVGGGKFLGFAMSKVEADYIPIHDLYGPSSRRQKFPGRDWRFLVRAAENLATAIAEVHHAGHVVGDINHSNALVNNDALVRFIDADSFQVQHGGAVHRCTVGVPEFTPPELQGLNLASVDRTSQHDLFGLAVLIFKLLFMGRHPFSGRFARGDVAIPDAIKQGLFAYSGSMGQEAAPPPNTLDLQDVGEDLADLFDRAFLTPLAGRHARPDGQTWVRALRLLQRNVDRCTRHASHYYPRTGRTCIWCDFRAQGIDYFPDPAAAPPPVVGPVGHIALDDAMVARLWAAVAAVPKRPGFDESIPGRSFAVTPPPPLQASAGWSVDEGVGCWGLIIAGGSFLYFGTLGLVVVGSFAALYFFLGSALRRWSVLRQERDPVRRALVEQFRRQERLYREIVAIQTIVSRAVQEHEDSWRLLMSGLTKAHQDLVSRDARKLAEFAGAPARLGGGQRESFLRSKLIRAASIHGVGDTLTSGLISYGFESAWDVLAAVSSTSTVPPAAHHTGPPNCSRCGSVMKRRTARRGRRAGSDFWGCSRYPSCTGAQRIHPYAPSKAGTVSSAVLEQVPGIGPVKAAAVRRWARDVESQFRPTVNLAELVQERARIEASHSAQLQLLARQLRSGPEELAAVNRRFSALTSSHVAQLTTLEKEW